MDRGADRGGAEEDLEREVDGSWKQLWGGVLETFAPYRGAKESVALFQRAGRTHSLLEPAYECLDPFLLDHRHDG